MSNPLDRAVVLMQEGGVNYASAMRAFERLFIIRTLERHKGNQVKAAATMGMHRNTLHRKMGELLIDTKPSHDEGSDVRQGAKNLLPENPKWISVRDRLPEQRMAVLTNQGTAYLAGDRWMDDRGEPAHNQITRWLDMPSGVEQ